MLISLQSDLKKRIRLSLIIDLANNSIGSSECRDSTSYYVLTIANSSDSKLLSLYFFRLREPPYWMSFPVKVDTKLREGSMLSRVFICEHSTRNICTRHTPKNNKKHLNKIYFTLNFARHRWQDTATRKGKPINK